MTTESSVSLSTSHKKTPEMAEKTSNHQLLKPQKIKEYNNSWMTDFLWQRREDDVDTAKSSVPR